MKRSFLSSVFLLVCTASLWAQEAYTEREMGIGDVQALIQQNRSVIIENINQRIATENYEQQQAVRLPELNITGDGYYDHRLPIAPQGDNKHSLLYHFNITSEWDLYAGGLHTNSIRRMKNELELSEERQKEVGQRIELQAYVLLYDIYRNLKYKDFIESSIHLREKEYERIEQLYENGLVLKSDLLRSQLYITNLEKDKVAIENSIDILSDELCVLLGEEERYRVKPMLDADFDHRIVESFDELFGYALEHSPKLMIRHKMQQSEVIRLEETRADQRPQLKLYAQYGVGSSRPVADYQHQLGGEVGARMSIPLSALYKSNHHIKAQRQRVEREQLQLTDEEENLRATIYELYTRYHESLINIDIAKEKIDLSKESRRILTNSYFNQQALLIDVLESETQSMKASFELVEALVNSQKYYWAIRRMCGYL